MTHLLEHDTDVDTDRAPRAGSRAGRASLALLALSVVLQGVSLVQQLSYLFAPRPGELPVVVIVLVAAVLAGLGAIVAGVMALRTRSGRRAGAFGAALAAATLILFAALTSFGWGFLEALSQPV